MTKQFYFLKDRRIQKDKDDCLLQIGTCTKIITNISPGIATSFRNDINYIIGEGYPGHIENPVITYEWIWKDGFSGSHIFRVFNNLRFKREKFKELPFLVPLFFDKDSPPSLECKDILIYELDKRQYEWLEDWVKYMKENK